MFRNKYWSCSEFANKIRGSRKPIAATREEWYLWKRTARNKHPLRYWIAEELLDNVQNFLAWPADKFNDIRYYTVNRWIARTHQLTADPKDIKPGAYSDLRERMLYCNFNELVNFVEKECAWMNVVFSEDNRKKYNTPFWGAGICNTRSWRCPEAGIDHLNFQAESSEHSKAKEILCLYYWWTEMRPARKHPYDISGWNKYCEDYERSNPDRSFFDKTEEEKKKALDIIDEGTKIEELYEQEDEDMLVRLMRVRLDLWT